jgi:hypothetical protein
LISPTLLTFNCRPVAHSPMKRIRIGLAVPASPHAPTPEDVGSPDRFRWTAELAAMLGKRPDAEVATLAGVCEKTVVKERKRREIPAFTRRRAKIEWTREMLDLLGTAGDAQIG